MPLETSTSRERRPSATTSSACAIPSSDRRGRHGGPDPRVMPFHRDARQERRARGTGVREAPRCRASWHVNAALLPARHHLAVRSHRHWIDDGGATDRLFHRRGARAPERADTRPVRDPAGGKPVGERLDGHDRSDQRAARARTDPIRKLVVPRILHGTGFDGNCRLRRDRWRLARGTIISCRLRAGRTGRP